MNVTEFRGAIGWRSSRQLNSKWAALNRGPPISREDEVEEGYFKLANVKSEDSLTTNTWLHQFEPTPVGFILEKSLLNAAV